MRARPSVNLPRGFWARGIILVTTFGAQGGTQMDLAYPFAGTWLVQNSPANRVPSHGTLLFASSYAIDFVPVGVNGRSAPFTLRSLGRPESPERFPGFGREVLAPVAGTVVAVHDTEPDHDAYRGLPSIGYALTQRQRAGAGWPALAGNYIFIEAGGNVVALCHLQRGSARVRPGQAVEAGTIIARCGNSGNSTEPHLHLQVIDDRSVERARALPVTFSGALPANGEIVSA